MHSSDLRGTDFEIFVDGRQQDHADFFRGWTNTRRLGFVAPERIDGVGAINLIMAHVTAFYDHYRAIGEEFFAYPDFFAFQPAGPLASYSMLDFAAEHKWVNVGDDAGERLNTINDHGVNVLIVPDGTPIDRKYHRIQLPSARRNIDTCYVYSFEGHVSDADLTIRCQKEPFFKWTQTVFDTPELAGDPTVQQRKSEWISRHEETTFIEQSFRKITLDEALSLL